MQGQGEFTQSSPDPLKGMHGKPILGLDNSDTRYLGRVVIELYESPDLSDAHALAYSVDAATDPATGTKRITSKSLLERVAAAFPIRLAKSPPRNS